MDVEPVSDQRAGGLLSEAHAGLPIYAVHHLERGTVLIAERKGGGKCIVEGRGLQRGVAYFTYDHGIERGYLLSTSEGGRRAVLCDAVNGLICIAPADELTEVEERYRKPTIEQAVLRDQASRGDFDAMRELANRKDPVYRDAFREACIEVLGEDPDDWQ